MQMDFGVQGSDSVSHARVIPIEVSGIQGFRAGDKKWIGGFDLAFSDGLGLG
jgi:hypothetical protein